MKWREYIRVLLVQGIYLRRIYFSLPWVVINLGWNDPFLSLPKRTLGLLHGIFLQMPVACRLMAPSRHQFHVKRTGRHLD